MYSLLLNNQFNNQYNNNTQNNTKIEVSFKALEKTGPVHLALSRRQGILTTRAEETVYTMFSQASALLSVCMWSALYLHGAAQALRPCAFSGSNEWF